MTAQQHVDYDAIANRYNERFQEQRDRPANIAALQAQVRALGECYDLAACRVLEVGCGTARWIAALAPTSDAHGLDLSAGMLHQARQRPAELALVRGHATTLPYRAATFDLVYCVNALHHFGDPRAFIRDARRLLRPGGALTVIGNDPRGHQRDWYVYEHFAGTYETDLERFPSWGDVRAWMAAAGLVNLTRRSVEHIVDPKIGSAVLDDPFLQKHMCSQLALLSDDAYAAGLRHIQSTLATDPAHIFRVDLHIESLTAHAPNT